MRNIGVITIKELKSFFFSPIAYIVIYMFLLTTGYFYFTIVSYYYQMQYSQYSFYMGTMTLNEAVLSPFYGNMSVILLLMIPVITMRLFSEELKHRTIDLLFSSPVTSTEIVFGKFLSATIFYLIMLLLTLHYPLIMILFGNPDKGPILSTYIGLFLLGITFISIGLLTSSLTENQIIAAVISFGIILLFWVINWASSSLSGFARELVSYISIQQHLEPFLKGAIDTKDLFFYLSFIATAIFITCQRVESLRWR